MGIALSPVPGEVSVDPTIELPTVHRADNQASVSGTQEVPPYSFYCFSVTLFGVLRKTCALMYVMDISGRVDFSKKLSLPMTLR